MLMSNFYDLNLSLECVSNENFVSFLQKNQFKHLGILFKFDSIKDVKGRKRPWLLEICVLAGFQSPCFLTCQFVRYLLDRYKLHLKLD